MPQPTALDGFNLPTVDDLVNGQSQYLSKISPEHKPWETHRGESDDVAEVYSASPFGRHHRYAERITECSRILGFSARDPPTKTGKQKLKLTDARFCRVRFCVICQWRRSLKWQARVYRALPRLVADYPQVRFLFITLTVKNCPVQMLRKTLVLMNRAWARLIELKVWPALGWVRSVEVTHGRIGDAHPHFHALLMVQPEYFAAGYIKQVEWSALWQQSLRADYRPIVDVRVVKPDHRMLRHQKMVIAHIWGALAEVLKYAVKPSDMVRDPQWFLTLTDQLHKMRFVAVGGILKSYIRDRDREQLPDELEKEMRAAAVAGRIFFGWQPPIRRYQKLNK